MSLRVRPKVQAVLRATLIGIFAWVHPPNLSKTLMDHAGEKRLHPKRCPIVTVGFRLLF